MNNDFEDMELEENAAQDDSRDSGKEADEGFFVYLNYSVPYSVKTKDGRKWYSYTKFRYEGSELDEENNVLTVRSKDKIYISFPGEEGMATGSYKSVADGIYYDGLFYSFRSFSEEDEYLLDQAADYYEAMVGLCSDLDCIGISKLYAKTPYDSEEFQNTQQYIHFCTMLSERLRDEAWKEEFMKAAWRNVATYLSNEVVE